jgi:hypothetical protein
LSFARVQPQQIRHFGTGVQNVHRRPFSDRGARRSYSENQPDVDDRFVRMQYVLGAVDDQLVSDFNFGAIA